MRVRGAVGVVLAFVVGFFAVTAFTGSGGPGPLRRYPYAELDALVRQIDAEAGPIRTPDDCWRTLHGNEGPVREVARVDVLRSRVVLRAYASESGRIDAMTFNAVTDRLDAIIGSDGRFTWSMVQIEPSPDGWSPMVSCRLVTRGWITGF